MKAGQRQAAASMTDVIGQVVGPQVAERVMAHPVAQQVAAHPAARRAVDVAQRPEVQRVLRSPWARRVAAAIGLWGLRRAFGLLRRPLVWAAGGIAALVWFWRRSPELD
jgi:hypothetical protein